MPDSFCSVSCKSTQLALGKQTETFILNMNAQLAFEHFRNFHAKALCPNIYKSSTFIKGQPGQLGSVCYQELLDGSRSYEMKIVGIDECKRVVHLETIDYKEPTAESSSHPGPHRHQASRRMVKIKVSELTNPLAEDVV